MSAFSQHWDMLGNGTWCSSGPPLPGNVDPPGVPCDAPNCDGKIISPSKIITQALTHPGLVLRPRYSSR